MVNHLKTYTAGFQGNENKHLAAFVCIIRACRGYDETGESGSSYFH